ncbi:head-tail connector protein [Hutsoniella sourekii]|uniref:head-tail connector protein n=1 Tax=Hutsoniella sourekii TaxID=87650 RepID=UPI0004B7F701|nr:head-tail connector protein [Hutsoniella sourekii]
MAFTSDLEAVKARLHILHDDDNENLKQLLAEGEAYIRSTCGDFDMTKDVNGRKLVFEYVRFAYHGKTEHFYTCFFSELSSFSFELLPEVGDLDG